MDETSQRFRQIQSDVHQFATMTRPCDQLMVTLLSVTGVLPSTGRGTGPERHFQGFLGTKFQRKRGIIPAESPHTLPNSLRKLLLPFTSGLLYQRSIQEVLHSIGSAVGKRHHGYLPKWAAAVPRISGSCCQKLPSPLQSLPALALCRSTHTAANATSKALGREGAVCLLGHLIVATQNLERGEIHQIQLITGGTHFHSAPHQVMHHINNNYCSMVHLFCHPSKVSSHARLR